MGDKLVGVRTVGSVACSAPSLPFPRLSCPPSPPSYTPSSSSCLASPPAPSAMSSVAGRKKSIISSAAVQIDIPVAHNTLLNQSASQSTSLYQRCAILRARLLTIDRFSEFFQLSAPSDSSRRSTDPVTQVWDCLAIGAPLVYLFNLLPPPYKPIEGVDPDPSTFNIHDERLKKRAIAFFSMRIHEVPDCEGFKVTDLSDRDSTDGFVKVRHIYSSFIFRPLTVSQRLSKPSPFSSMPSQRASSQKSLLLHLPCQRTPPSLSPQQLLLSLFPQTHRKPPGTTSLRRSSKQSVNMYRTSRLCRSVLSSSHYFSPTKLLLHPTLLQTYAQALSQSSTIDQDTIHLLFPNLNKLLNFQRKFLIRVEGTAELPWKDMRWGILFTENVSPTFHRSLVFLSSKRIAQYGLLNMFLANARHVLPLFTCSPFSGVSIHNRPFIFLSFCLSRNKRRRSSPCTSRTAPTTPMHPS